MKHDEKGLLAAAHTVREKAYARYSGFFVGAALRDERGALHIGCNVENASYPLGACAEANAIGAMVAAGGTRIAAIAIVGGHDTPVRCLPCGGCRQRIAEFANDDTTVVIADANGAVTRYTLDELLPESFTLHTPE